MFEKAVYQGLTPDVARLAAIEAHAAVKTSGCANCSTAISQAALEAYATAARSGVSPKAATAAANAAAKAAAASLVQAFQVFRLKLKA